MSKFQLYHHNEIAFTIGEWIKLNPDLNQDHIQSLINGFILLLKADSNQFNSYLFYQAINEKS